MRLPQVIALGGSLLRPEESENRKIWFGKLRQLAVHIEGNSRKLGIVVGGGLPAREGISLALLKRPVKDGQINQAVENIKIKVNDRLDREVFSHEIGEMVMDELKQIDEVAYVRFASVYREFKDASEFIETVQLMQSPEENDSDQ